MKIKKYQAVSMSEAMDQIRAELGKDAVILNSKVVFSGGILGFFKKKRIEVIAAVDQEPMQIPVRKEKYRKTEPATMQMKPKTTPGNITYEKDMERKQKPVKGRENEILKELNELKRLVGTISPLSEVKSLPAPIAEIISLLKRHEINEDAINEVQRVLSSKMEEQSIELAEAVSIARDYLKEMLPPEAKGMFGKKYINVVGPTGVGKTTTLAKLAAANSLKDNKRVAFITTDTFRIAAIDQLKTYANILNVPIKVAYNFEDFKNACSEFTDFDHVFIDTAGRNFLNKEYVEDLRNIISFNDEMETYLVLSLTSKQQDMETIFNQFSLLPISYFIFTKLDETSSYGAMFNMVTKFDTNIAYATNGQNVPDDLIKANPDKIIQSIIGDLLNERPS